jgi:DNA processing protein
LYGGVHHFRQRESIGYDGVALDLMTLLDAPGVGPSRVRKLLKRWQLVGGHGFLLDDSLLRETLTASQVAALPASRERVKRHWDELAKKNVQAVSILDPAYPDELKQTLGEDAPVLLLCIGKQELFRKTSVHFCGSQEATEKGMATARDSADLMARDGVNIVSGFAAGVDMNAHRAALAAGGTKTVVLAEEILRFRAKEEIREEWDEQRTLVVTECGPSLPRSGSHAMQRSRTICGLSRALILIEARRTGGSMQAGRDCLKLGLPLFAAVYEGMPEAATGNQELLQQGARRLMKIRSTNRQTIQPIRDVIRSAPHGPDPTKAASQGRHLPLPS